MSGSKAARSAVRALIGLVVLVAWTMTSGPAVAGPIAYNNPGVFGLDVWLVNPDGSNNQRVPVPADLLQAFGPVWSRDGRAIGAMGVITGAAANRPLASHTALRGRLAGQGARVLQVVDRDSRPGSRS